MVVVVEVATPKSTRSPMHTQISSASDALCFALAGNARMTLRSQATGNHYSYRVQCPKDDEGNLDKSIHFVKVLCGPDNESDYRYIGYVKNERFFHGGAKSFASKEAQSVIAFGWALKHLTDLEIPKGLEVFHEGRCGRCGLALTVPASIQSGLGPVCRGK
jgi:hypothetical protein